jgi:pyridine nucleotide-disulfide oxidoreductase
MTQKATIKNQPRADCDVAVIGAGPYGLSAAAYLQSGGLCVRVFGEPMSFWADRMPQGMLLRSPRVASNIADPRSALTLRDYEAATGSQPAAPVPLSTFVSYGRWFREQLGSSLTLTRTPVSHVARNHSGFKLTLKDGVKLTSRRVVVAAGIGAFRRTPEVFGRLTPLQLSHCYEGRAIGEFRSKRVAVVGAGQSALESAALLHEAGADVEVIARVPTLRWIGQHSWLHGLGPLSSLLYSKHDVGPLGISRLVAYPNVLFRLPLSVRDKVRTRAVRPAGAPWLVERLASVTMTTGQTIVAADPVGREVRLKLGDGTERRVDHVLLGTGYRVDLSRYEFLSPNLLAGVHQRDGSPVLAPGFRSTVPGLHFIGAAAARSFGPLLYFVAGTEFASRELSANILRNPLNG